MNEIKLAQQLSSIEQRLSSIERCLDITPAIPRQPIFIPKPDVSEPQTYDTVIKPSETPKPGNWMGTLAIICFILAAGFIIKLSIDTGWLTPSRQIGIAYLFGFALISSGFGLLKIDSGYASLLPGGGIIVLYITTLAAHTYHHLISFETAIVAVSAVSLLCIWLYLHIKHDIYPIVAAAGSYIAPIILGLHTETVFSLYYFIMCSFAFCIISIWVHSRTLTLIASYMAIFSTAIVGSTLNQPSLIVIMLGLHFTIFIGGTFAHSIFKQEPLTEIQAGNFFPVLLIFYASEYHFLFKVAPSLAPWISLGFAAMLLALYLLAKKAFPTQTLSSEAVVIAFASIVGFHAGYMELMTESMRPWLFVFIIIASAFISYTPPNEHKNSLMYKIPTWCLVTILLVEYFSIVSHLYTLRDPSWIMVGLAAFASIWFAILTNNEHKQRFPLSGTILLGSAHLIAILAFYQITKDMGSLAVSASWLIYALAVIVIASSRKDAIMARSATFILAFATAKALLYDAASAPTIIRIFCLILTGVVLYSSGFLMRKIAQWSR